jgi:hypothetical protein
VGPTGHVARMGGIRISYKMSVAMYEENEPDSSGSIVSDYGLDDQAI